MSRLWASAVTGFVFLATAALPAANAHAQSLQAETWSEVFSHGFPTLERLGEVERIGTDSPPSLLGAIYGKCDFGAPDTISLVASPEYSRGRMSWRPSFTAGELPKDQYGRFQRIDAPGRVDTMRAAVARQICDLEGGPHSLVLEHGGRYVHVDLPSEPWLGFVWLFAENTNGSLEQLRWSPVTERLETFSDARRRWREGRWTERAISAVLGGNLYIGMTAEMVRESWGNPQRVNSTTTAAGRREQLVYGSSQYIYVTNGRVSAIQH